MQRDGDEAQSERVCPGPEECGSAGWENNKRLVLFSLEVQFLRPAHFSLQPIGGNVKKKKKKEKIYEENKWNKKCS